MTYSEISSVETSSNELQCEQRFYEESAPHLSVVDLLDSRFSLKVKKKKKRSKRLMFSQLKIENKYLKILF